MVVKVYTFHSKHLLLTLSRIGLLFEHFGVAAQLLFDLLFIFLLEDQRLLSYSTVERAIEQLSLRSFKIWTRVEV